MCTQRATRKLDIRRVRTFVSIAYLLGVVSAIAVWVVLVPIVDFLFPEVGEHEETDVA
jgi:hypothetical protein